MYLPNAINLLCSSVHCGLSVSLELVELIVCKTPQSWDMTISNFCTVNYPEHEIFGICRVYVAQCFYYLRISWKKSYLNVFLEIQLRPNTGYPRLTTPIIYYYKYINILKWRHSTFFIFLLLSATIIVVMMQ